MQPITSYTRIFTATLLSNKKCHHCVEHPIYSSETRLATSNPLPAHYRTISQHGLLFVQDEKHILPCREKVLNNSVKAYHQDQRRRFAEPSHQGGTSEKSQFPFSAKPTCIFQPVLTNRHGIKINDTCHFIVVAEVRISRTSKTYAFVPDHTKNPKNDKQYSGQKLSELIHTPLTLSDSSG